MIYYSRYLKIDLPPRQSAFLWGARKTGKSSFLKQAFPEAIYYDLLQSDLFLRLAKEPHLLREQLLALEKSRAGSLVIIDEVQKIPLLLDEVHWLIENTSFQFILCGSSARKLKRTGANLLGGRAWKYHFYPLVFPEMPDFNLLTICQHGTIPAHYHSTAIKKALRSYIEDYLTEEIQHEGLVRNLPSFARFIDALQFSHGEMVNYANIARECGVSAKTVKEYFHILIDTLLGYFIFPYRRRVGRDIIMETPKFYFFDVGVANAIKRQWVTELRGAEAGKSLEHYVLLELMAYNHLTDKDFAITYWRTKTGIEVDFILGQGEIAIEVKITHQVQSQDLSGLRAFMEEHQPHAAYVVCLESKPRKMGNIDILPVQLFLERLWNHQIIQ